jgi:hypothetical protein
MKRIIVSLFVLVSLFCFVGCGEDRVRYYPAHPGFRPMPPVHHMPVPYPGPRH